MASGSCISEDGLADLWALLDEEFDDMGMTTTTTTDQDTTPDHDHNKTMTSTKTTQQTMTYAMTTQPTTSAKVLSSASRRHQSGRSGGSSNGYGGAMKCAGTVAWVPQPQLVPLGETRAWGARGCAEVRGAARALRGTRDFLWGQTSLSSCVAPSGHTPVAPGCALRSFAPPGLAWRGERVCPGTNAQRARRGFRRG